MTKADTTTCDACGTRYAFTSRKAGVLSAALISRVRAIQIAMNRKTGKMAMMADKSHPLW